MEEWHKAQLVGFARPLLGQCDCLCIVPAGVRAQRSVVIPGRLAPESALWAPQLGSKEELRKNHYVPAKVIRAHPVLSWFLLLNRVS